MSIFTEFPYQNFHELNLDWIIKKVKELTDEWLSFEENMKKWKDDTDEAMKALKEFVMDYFDNLDVQDEINNKLDEMAEDGTLDDIINQHIFEDLNDDIKHAPFMPDPDMYDDYLDDMCDCIASYLASSVDCDSVVGESSVTPKAVYVYNNGNGYMGVLGQGSGFVYTDTRTIDGVTYPVAYIDCSQFVSLITKCRNFDNSPYKYAFENINNINARTLRAKCFEYGDLDSKPYTLDFLNYIYTARMAYIMNASGNTIRKLSSRTGTEPAIFTDELDKLEDGDIIFVGNPIAHTNEYLNIHHVMIYFKNLTRLNQAAANYGVELQDLDGGDHSEHGYVVHVTGTTGSSANTIRINTLYAYANSMPSNGYRILYHTHNRSNALNSNKAMSALTMMTMTYDQTGFGYRNSGNMDWYDYIRISQSDRGRLLLQQLSYQGAQMPDNTDLDTIGDGYFRCVTSSASNSCSNKPDFIGSYFDIITVGTEAGITTGMQIAVSNYAEFAFRRKKIGSSEWQSWGLYRGMNPMKHGYHDFGAVNGHTKSTYHVTFSTPFENLPRVVTGLNMTDAWAADSLVNFAVTYANVTTAGFDLIVANGNDTDANNVRASWFAY